MEEKRYYKIRSYLDYLYSLNYKERPVKIRDFVESNYFLGKITVQGKAIYPGWWDVIEQIFVDDTRYIVVFTGAIGIGKTWIACAICIPYILYRISCLKDPWSYFELAESGKFDVSFFNLTKSLSATRGFQYLQNALLNSYWFRKHGGGVIKGKAGNEWMELPLFNWVLASPYAKGFSIQGANVVCGIMDEVDSPVESKGQKERILQAYDATVRRFESRFVKDGRSLGRLFLVASKQDELSFLNVYIEQMKDRENVFIVDKPIWEMKPKYHYSGKTFSVLVGDAYTPSKILENEEEKREYIKQGFRVIEVPEEYRPDFELDIIGALRDLAGIAVKGQRRYKLFPSVAWIRFDETKEDPVTVDTLEVSLEDDFDWINVIDLSKFRQDLKVPRYIHLDIAISGDAMAIACSCVAGWQEVEEQEEEGTFRRKIVPVIETDFILRVKAKKEQRIPLAKMRKFILDLRRAGLNIAKFTADLRLASEDTLQILQKAGIRAEYFSVDRNTQASLDFRNLVYEGRWLCHYHKWLFFEMKHIEHDREKNKIDHPETVKEIEVLQDGNIREYVMEGSKDCFDAVVGSVYNCLLEAKRRITPEEAKQMLEKVKERRRSEQGLQEDWFIQDEQTKQEGGIVMNKTEALRKALQKLRRRKRGGLL